jgi:tetratricopeptide (TPR) repeat protein
LSAIALRGATLLFSVGLAASAAETDTAQSLYKGGLEAGEKGRFTEAETRFARVLALDPWYVPARRALDLLADLRGGRTDGPSARLLFQGLVFQERLEWRQALARYEEAVRKRPGDYYARHNLAAAYFETGRNQEAIAQFEEASRLNPSYAYTHNSLGLALDRARRPEEALESYRRAMELDPFQFRACKNAAVSLRWLGRKDEAQAYYRRALVINPDYPQAYQGAELTPEEREPFARAMRGENSEALLGHVATGSWQIRKVAVAELEQRREPSMLPGLLPLLHDRSPLVRYLAAHVAGTLGEAPVAGAAGDDRAARMLSKALGDPDWVVRREAGYSLGRVRGERACRSLVHALARERDDLVRMGLVAALGGIGRACALPALVSALLDPIDGVRRTARDQLLALPGWDTRALAKKQVPALLPLLEDEEPTLRARAADALGATRDRRATAPLIGALDDGDAAVRDAAAAALRRITGRDFGSDSSAWRGWWEGGRR